jgi:hypothetical protein
MEAESHIPMIGCHAQDMCIDTDTSAVRSMHNGPHHTWLEIEACRALWLPSLGQLWTSDPALANRAPGRLWPCNWDSPPVLVR